MHNDGLEKHGAQGEIVFRIENKEPEEVISNTY